MTAFPRSKTFRLFRALTWLALVLAVLVEARFDYLRHLQRASELFPFLARWTSTVTELSERFSLRIACG